MRTRKTSRRRMMLSNGHPSTGLPHDVGCLSSGYQESIPCRFAAELFPPLHGCGISVQCLSDVSRVGSSIPSRRLAWCLADHWTPQGPVRGYTRSGCGWRVTHIYKPCRPPLIPFTLTHLDCRDRGSDGNLGASRRGGTTELMNETRADTPLPLPPLPPVHSQSYGELVLEEGRARPQSIAWRVLGWGSV